jgi:hypothetical protein
MPESVPEEATPEVDERDETGGLLQRILNRLASRPEPRGRNPHYVCVGNAPRPIQTEDGPDGEETVLELQEVPSDAPTPDASEATREGGEGGGMLERLRRTLGGTR